ncbi:MAG TPA: D-arabinono-1,4-lactone oxidase [Kofleriaceae bacterium]|nr:D-arabinono-1,4-lactone oxidase [Kofleriaceae bacterium]
MAEPWHNWSGSVAAQPARVAAPRSEAELADVVRGASSVRVVGAGHSFMPLCATDGALVSLDALDSPVELAEDDRTAWAPAGWSLRRVAEALWALDHSLPNQGDIDDQALGGAIATGTHGTGEALGSLSTIARGFRMMLADGTVVACSRDAWPALFEAARLSLGLVGVATRIRIDVVPAYRLEQRIERVSLDEVAERFADIAQRHRHAEFFAFPYSDDVFLKTLHPTDDASPFEPPGGDAEREWQRVCDRCHALPFATGWLQRRLMAGIRGSRRVGPAHQIFPSERTVRFEEMEYEVPRDAGFPALREAIRWIRRRRRAVIFPFEFRWTAADDIWLSPFNRGPCASISVHQYARRSWQALFRDLEPIFRDHAGRPHWAKRHTLTAPDVFALYPRAAEFCAVRREVDPQGKFANDHLTRLFDLQP